MTKSNNVENLNITVMGTDGTTMKYTWNSGAYRCKEIKDSNGNFITINHDETGLLRTVTDTLSRVITVNYEESNGQHYPTTITQNWQNGIHTYAMLSYKNETINTNFDPTFAVFGPPNGTILKVLDKITFADNSSVRFDYNTYGQVKQINNHAADSHKLNHTATNLGNISSIQTDCPRFTETRNYVENFNNNAETIVTNSFQTNQTYTLPDGGTATGNLIEVAFTGDPHNRISKTFTGNSGWKEGLPIKTEDFVNNVQKRWTWTDYGNSDTLVRNNPRVIESKVGDTENGNIRRTKVEYNNPAALQYGLPTDTLVYDIDQTTVLKKSTTEYNLSSVYTSRRIIGLPSKTETRGLENGILKLTGKTTYAYDEGNFSDTSLEQNIAPIQHDNTNFAANFIIGRGNTTSVTRWNVDVGFENDVSQAQKSSVKYNTAGSPVASIDVMGRTIKTSYADNWAVGGNAGSLPATYAYPTKLTDPAGNFSQVKYRFDIGANVWAKSPAPNGQTQGKITTREFDEIGRIQKQKIENYLGAYTRYEYLPSQIQSKVYTTVTDANNDGDINASDEVLAESFYDGEGRVRKSRSPMIIDTVGNTLTWVGQQIEYDILGRTKRQSAPTEIDNSWNPTGDDFSRGWQWSSQVFDWKNRVEKEVGLDGVDRFISYEGCGCAGGQITTVKGELVDGKRRTQKIYSDILGRNNKTETLDYDNNVYKTDISIFDARDQVISYKEFTGDTSGVFQETTMTYDGFGRLKNQHNPEQDAGKFSAYSYNLDNSIHSMTDARNATSTYTYNNRGLVERVDYALPYAASSFPTINPNSSGVSNTCSPEDPNYPNCGGPTPTPNPAPYLSNVQFQYDALGNRTQMLDTETGTTNYVYDQLSRMTAEQKILRSDWAIPTHNFDINYTYDLTGRLASVTDPFGARIDYKADKLGRLEQITGTPFGANGQSVTDYVDNIEYRAWGAIKHVDYGNNVQMNQTFDSRLRVSEFKVSNPTNVNTNPPMDFQTYIKKNYEYYNDNLLKFSDDNGQNVTRDPAKFDRSFKYDFAGRLTEARTGEEARGGTVTDRNEIPYKQDYSYNAFSNVTSRSSQTWTQTDNEVNLWVNNRNSVWGYDADGRLKSTPQNKYFYDTSGEVVMSTLSNSTRRIRHLDGEGRNIRENEYVYHTYQYHLLKTEYKIYSTVLGKLLTEVNSNGQKTKTNIYGLGGIVATQNATTQTGVTVKWEHQDPRGESYIETASNGGMYYGASFNAELDPLGSNVGLSSPFATAPPENAQGPGGTRWGDPFGGYSCRLDGFEVACSQVAYALNSGSAGLDPSFDNYYAGQVGIRPIWETRDIEVDRSKDSNSGVMTVYTDIENYISGYQVWGSGWGSPMHITPEPIMPEPSPLVPPPPPPPNPCDDIIKKIRAAYKQVVRRAIELKQDYLDFVGRGVITKQDLKNHLSTLNSSRDLARVQKQGFLDGHKQQFENQQRGLVKNLKNYLDNNCNDRLPFKVTDVASMPVPVRTRAPNVNTSPLSEWQNEIEAAAAGAGLAGSGVIIYWVISEGTRLFPGRNLIPIP